MASTPNWRAIAAQLCSALGETGEFRHRGTVSGGDIHHACRARLGERELFIKLNRAERAALFEAEATALSELHASGTLRLPEPICHGHDRTHAWLVLEFLPLRRAGDAASLGRGLAAMHRVHGPAFGWDGDNYIGATPQRNDWSRDWPGFWFDRRLGFQIDLAVANGYPGSLRTLADRFRERAPSWFMEHHPPPALLHGDLWGGNHAYLPDGTPVVFDPASYYGDRETDLAMTELFGGFDADFHAAYREAHALDDGYRLRRPLYQLYHLLNHLNLFGASWLPRVERVLEALLTRAD